MREITFHLPQRNMEKTGHQVSSTALFSSTESAPDRTSHRVALDAFSDLLEEVRTVTDTFLQRANALQGMLHGSSADAALKCMISSALDLAAPRDKIVCFAAAAELGLSLHVPVEHCSPAMNGPQGIALRTLFWTAHRRMEKRVSNGN